MCFDGCSSSLSPTRFEKLQPQPIIYLLGRFHVSEMFSHKCTYCAPASQLFMLQLCHSSMSLHPLSAKRKEWGEGERGIEETGLSSDILSGSPGYCALGETTPVIAITLAGRAANTHECWTKTAPGTHTYTITFVSILMSTLKNTVPWMFSAKQFPCSLFCW